MISSITCRFHTIPSWASTLSARERTSVKLAALISCACLWACGESEVNLVAGYKYVQLDGHNFAISGSDNRMVVDPNVVRYKIVSPYVVGERKKSNIEGPLSQAFGFFILDINSGNLVEGLDGAAFADALRVRNLPADPFE